MSAGARRPEQHEETRRVRDLLVSVGVCPECHWRLAWRGKLYCRACLKKIRDAARLRRSKYGRAYQGLKRCGVCRRRGHDARWCTSKRAIA